MDRESVRHFVYRLHGEDGEVIYVGRSCNVPKRLSAHHSAARNKYLTGKDWFYAVRSVSMFGPMNWDDVIEAERREVARLQPPGNIALTARDHRPFVAYMSTQGGSEHGESWANESDATVRFDVDASGRVLIERNALAMLLVAAGFEQQESAR